MKRKIQLLLLSALAFLIWQAAPGLFAGDAENEFDAANKLYERGKYPDAAAAYEKLAQSGRVSAALYFNLGNAYFKSSQMGRAIAAYRAAEQLSPRDPDIRANLQFARNQIQGPTLPPGRWQKILCKLTADEWTMLGLVPGWLCLIGLTAMQIRPAWKPVLRGFSIATGAVALAAGLFLSLFLTTGSDKTAIIIHHDVTVRSGPLDEAQTIFTAHDGAELSVLDAKDNWLQVTTDNQHLGWVRRGDVAVFPKAG